MRHLASLTIAAMLLTLLAAVSPAEAARAPVSESRARVAATTKSDCYDYASHQVCVVLHRNAKGRVWATAAVDKISGSSNFRYARAVVYTRACKASKLVERAEKRIEVRGEATASARTATIAWDKRLFFQARVLGGWARLKQLPSGATQIKNSKAVAVTTPALSACAAG